MEAKAKKYFDKEYGNNHIKNVVDLKDLESLYALMQEYADEQLRLAGVVEQSEQLVCAVPDCKNEPIKDAKHGLCGKHIWPNAN